MYYVLKYMYHVRIFYVNTHPKLQKPPISPYIYPHNIYIIIPLFIF